MTDRPVVVAPLIEVGELVDRMVQQRLPVLLDVRWSLAGPPGVDGFRQGHLPGAVFADLDRDLSGEPGPGGRGGRHPLPTPEAAESALRRLGVCGNRPVVVYDDSAGTVAARAWWLLRYLGHDDVRLLDGGLSAWVAAGHPLTAGDTPAPAVGDFRAAPGAMPVLDAVGAAAVAADGVLLDARAGERYRGETEPVDPVAGHVPGAVSAPTRDGADQAGRLLPAAALRDRFTALGAADGGVVGAYCGSGVTAAHTVLALEVAGLPAALYVGSWSDWVSDPGRPVATGA